MTERFAGVDMGGTGTRVVIVDAGEVVTSRTVPTHALGEGEPEDRVRRLASLIQDTAGRSGITAVGLGASGPINVFDGTIDNDATLPRFSHFPLRGMLAQAISAPVVVENDAVTAAIAEHALGAGRGARNLLMVTLGTGIGASLLLDGEPFKGSEAMHPEPGHIPVDVDAPRCYCGLERCWEQAASRLGLERQLRPHFPSGAANGELLGVAAGRAADSPELQAEFAAYGMKVGRGLGTLQTLYRPGVTVLGGAVSQFFQLIEGGLNAELARSSSFSRGSVTRPAELGDIAGAVGAAILARRSCRSRGVSAPDVAPR